MFTGVMLIAIFALLAANLTVLAWNFGVTIYGVTVATSALFHWLVVLRCILVFPTALDDHS